VVFQLTHFIIAWMVFNSKETVKKIIKNLVHKLTKPLSSQLNLMNFKMKVHLKNPILWEKLLCISKNLFQFSNKEILKVLKKICDIKLL